MRKLLGTRCAGDGAAEDMTGTSLDHLADLAAKVEPGAAATIHQLTGTGVSESLQLVRLRAALDQGSAIGNDAYANHPGVPRAIVAQFVAFSNEMNGRPWDELYPAEASARYSLAMRFELEYVAFLRARQRGFVLEMQTIAASLRRLAGERGSALPVALQCQADASLRAGDVANAHLHLDLAGRLTFSRSDLRQFAAATMLQSKIALYENHTRRAEDLANGAFAVLNRHHRDAYAVPYSFHKRGGSAVRRGGRRWTQAVCRELRGTVSRSISNTPDISAGKGDANAQPGSRRKRSPLRRRPVSRD